MADAPGVLRAIYFEDEADQFTDHAPTLHKILQAKAGAVDVRHAATEADLLVEMKSRPHVVFCDNDHLGKPIIGLITISKLKIQYPDTVFCLLTSKGVKTQSLASYTPNPDAIISKSSLAHSAYEDYLQRKLRKLIRRSPLSEGPSIDFKRDGPSHSKKGVVLTREELHSLLEQVIDSEGVPVLASEFKSAELSPMTGGFSGAGVFNLSVTRSDGRQNVPAVLKISERSKSVQELENFLKFVKWRLPYLWRVDVLGTGHTGHFGAICYSFASGGGATPLAVNAYLRKGESKVIDKVLGSVLHSENQKWYEEQRPSGMDIREYFSQERFYRTSSKREVLESYFYAYLVENLELSKIEVVENDLWMFFDGVRYPKIDELIFAHGWGQVTECVCHGDLNGNNLLDAGGDHPVVFIDFQETGFWHVFRDFVSFETSVRLEHPVEREPGETDEALFRRYLKMERQLAEAQWKELKAEDGYVHVVSRVRNAAHHNFDKETFALYLVANIVHTLWMFERAGNWAVHKRLRMAATILESTYAMGKLREKTKTP